MRTAADDNLRTARDKELAPWPHAELDIAAARRAGHAPLPVRQFVVKAHSRCNLRCTYCIIYEGSDTAWRARPARVSQEVMRQTAHRIAEHAAAHRLSEVRVDLHGGEPLLAGADTAVAYTAAVRSALPSHTALRATVQTNGTLVTERVLDRLTDAGIQVGLSLDGGTARLNARRVDHAGRSSWPAVRRAAGLLTERPEIYAGVLCVIDLTRTPEEVYASLAALRPPYLDLLLPHANWSNPPPGLPSGPPRPWYAGPPAPTPYGDWLAAAFDLWWDDARGDQPRVRLFMEIVGLLLGVPSTTESVGLSPTCALVVETDGGIHQMDSLKVAYDRATATGLDVFRHRFDDALGHPGVFARHLGAAALAEECAACPVGRVCGGGNFGHRYHRGTGFRHPSVYCGDLERLVRHAARRLGEVLPRPG